MMTDALPVASGSIAEIVAFGRLAAARGWVPATAGNFSCRLDDRQALITRSGVDKGALTSADLVPVPLDGPVPRDVSAETPLHLARHRRDPAVGAIFHVHTVASTVLSRTAAGDGVLHSAGFEIHKAFAGIATHERELEIPIFANDQDTGALAVRIDRRIGPDAVVPGFLLAGHGLYAWGASIADARRHVEAFEFLFSCLMEERSHR